MPVTHGRWKSVWKDPGRSDAEIDALTTSLQLKWQVCNSVLANKNMGRCASDAGGPGFLPHPLPVFVVRQSTIFSFLISLLTSPSLHTLLPSIPQQTWLEQGKSAHVNSNLYYESATARDSKTAKVCLEADGLKEESD